MPASSEPDDPNPHADELAAQQRGRLRDVRPVRLTPAGDPECPPAPARLVGLLPGLDNSGDFEAMRAAGGRSALVPEDVGYAAHKAAVAHLNACWAHEEDGATGDGPASAPFCGCQDCEVREILFAAWPIFEAHRG